MKKQIRRNVFETNSSSTHSLTVQKITEDKPIILFENGILYPNRLNVITNNGGYYSDEFQQIKCRTKLEKMALIAYYIKNTDFDEIFYDVEDDCDKRKVLCNDFRKDIFEKFKKEFDLIDIDFESDSINHIDGYLDGNLSLYAESMEQFDKNFKEIIEIINDDTKELIDEYESNE